MRAFSIAIVAGFLVSLSTSAQAGCQAEEARIQQLMAERAQGMTYDSICYTARDTERVYRDLVVFYERCPINDPGGQMLQWGRDMTRWAQELQDSACAR